MGIGALNPGCVCCSCEGWFGTPPDELQVTLPAGCTLSGAHTLTRLATPDLPGLTNDCIVGNFPIDHVCEAWRKSIAAEGDCLDPTNIVVYVGDYNGRSVVMVGVCGDCPGGVGTFNSGTLWELSPPGIKDYADLDLLYVPYSARDDDQCDPDCPNKICTGTDDAVIEIPP